MALMLFHIPRTGGSSVWHSLAGVAAKQNKIIADLYHQSRQMTGHPFAPTEAVQYFHEFLQQTGLCFDNDVIYHHHTHQHVPYLLESDQVQRVTLLRDPVSRLVSEAFHMRRFFCEEHAKTAAGQPPSGEYEFHRKEYGPARFNEMIAADIDPDALVLSYAQANQNYYLTYFSNFLDPRFEHQVFDQTSALALAGQVREAFTWVGQFPELSEFIKTCGLLADLDMFNEHNIRHIANGSEVPALKAQTLAQIKAMNSLDYIFIDAVLQAYDKGLMNRLINQNEQRALRSESVIRDLNEELAKQTALAQVAQQERLEATAACALTAEELARCKGMLEAIHCSRSWQLTAPLRAVRSWFKRQ